MSSPSLSHSVLPQASLQAQSNQANKRYFAPRTSLPLYSNYLWQIEIGVVRTITFLEDGTLQTLGVWGPGDLIGQPLTAIEPYQIETLNQVEAFLVPMSHWQYDASVFIRHCQQLEELMMIRSYRKAEIMTLKLFSWLAKRFGRTVQDGQLIELRLTHQDIAEILGTTRVTITRILGQLEEQGLIDRLPLHRIVLKDYEMWHYEI